MTRSTRSDDVERVVAAGRAARVAGESAARWWRDLSVAADEAVTRHSLDVLAREALATMKVALDADSLSLLVANEAGDELVARVSTGLGEEATVGVGIGTGQGMAGRILASHEPLVIDDLTGIDLQSPVLRESGLRSIVAVPVLARDRLLGVLHAGSREKGHFTGSDAEMLALFADRLAGALERVRLFEAERTAREGAEDLAGRLSRLQTITSRLLGAVTAEEVSTALNETMLADGPGQVIGAIGIVLVSEDPSTGLSFVGGPGRSGGLPEALLDNDGPVAAAIGLGTGRFEASWPTGVAPGGHGDLAGARRGLSVLPMLLRGRLLGALVVVHGPSCEVDLHVTAFLATVADQAAQALDRAMLQDRQSVLLEESSFFARAATSMAEASGFADALDRLARLALTSLGDICIVDVIGEDGMAERMVARHRDPALQHLVSRLGERLEAPGAATHRLLGGLASGEGPRKGTFDGDLLRHLVADEQQSLLLEELGCRSFVSVPLVSRDGLLGALTFLSTGRELDAGDAHFATRLAEQVTALVANARRYERTFQTAHVLQAALLPTRLPTVPGWEIASRYLTATSGSEAGGDFYDVTVLPSHRIGFMIGDVVGHDHFAAAMMGQLRSAAKALGGQVREPCELISSLRWSWDLLSFERMATAIFGRLDPTTGQVVMASAGHHPPLLLGSGEGRFLALVPSSPLGAPPTEAEEHQCSLEPGQVLLLYTDGALDERTSGSDEAMARLARLAADGPLEPGAICDRVVAGMGTRRRDDLALLAIGRGSRA